MCSITLYLSSSIGLKKIEIQQMTAWVVDDETNCKCTLRPAEVTRPVKQNKKNPSKNLATCAKHSQWC